MSEQHKLSIIIPVYNEAESLPLIFEKLRAVDFGIETEFVFIDDRSSDDSFKIIESFALCHSHVKVFRQAQNQGKGAAIQSGIALASGTLIIIQDADLEYDPGDIPSLIQPILDDQADVVYGSRFMGPKSAAQKNWRRWANLFLTSASNFCSGLRLSDMETCYKVFRAEIIKNIALDSRRFGFEPEVTAKIAKLRLRIHEAPIRYYPRSYEEGKKIGWRDGLAALIHILHYNFFCSAKQCILSSLPIRYLPENRPRP